MPHKKRLYLFAFTAIPVYAALWANTAPAAGLQISPRELVLEGAGPETLSQTFVAANPTAQEQQFTVLADDFAEFLVIDPESFTLEPGGRKEVTVTVKPREKMAISQAKTGLSIISRPAKPGNSYYVASGIKLPLILKNIPAADVPPSRAPGLPYSNIFAAFLLFGLVATAVILKKGSPRQS